jgi:hypothetical protein
MNRTQMSIMITSLALAACGGGDGEAPEARSAPQPVPSLSAAPSSSASPGYDFVPLAKAKSGDLIRLPGYPRVAAYGGTQDVRGLTKLNWKILGYRGPVFAPTILIGKPGQKLAVTVKEPNAPPGLRHSFTTDSPRFNKTWSTNKTATFTITFPEKGEQIFYCKYHLPENTDYFMAGVLRAAT